MIRHDYNRYPALSDPSATPILALYGGPGTGKSTTAALLFAAYKQAGVNVELAHEVAKDYTWEGARGRLGNQALICSEQMWRYDRLNGKVDLIITDTSTLLGLHHCRGTRYATPAFRDWLVDDYRRRNTVNVFLTRNPGRPYNQSGRRQSEDSAKHMDTTIREMLRNLGIDHLEVEVGVDNDDYIRDILLYVDQRLR
jgi:predicted ATPase